MTLSRRTSAICILLTFALARAIASWLGLRASHAITFLAGICFVPLVRRTWSRMQSPYKTNDDHDPRESLYGLSHGRLNLKLNAPSMWMNMGYWKREHDYNANDTETEKMSLAEASRSLLCEVLKSAGLDQGTMLSPSPPQPAVSKTLIDLGIGCGEQTVYLNSPSPIRDSDREWWGDKRCSGIFDSYIGITIDRTQYAYADQRVRELVQSRRKGSMKEKQSDVRIFCADAAKPDEWKTDLHTHMLDSTSNGEEVWVLALDTLYHFMPSRWPIIEYASRTLNASFMAFDLCIADEPSTWNYVLLYVLTRFMGAPWANFSTREEYRNKLLQAGYVTVELKDVTEFVFSPLVDFLEDHNLKLQAFGGGLGPYHVAKWMFRWWARSGIIRGIVIVARK